MAPNRRVRCSYANAVALAAFAQEELGCRTATKDLIAFTEHTFRRLGTALHYPSADWSAHVFARSACDLVHTKAVA